VRAFLPIMCNNARASNETEATMSLISLMAFNADHEQYAPAAEREPLRHFDILLRGHRPENVLPMRIAAKNETEARAAAVAQVELDQNQWKRYEWLGEVEPAPPAPESAPSGVVSAESVAGQSRRRDERVRETLRRAGLSSDLRGYTGAERDRAASETAARLESGPTLRRYIMGDGERG
jgi:hypothetical protein